MSKGVFIRDGDQSYSEPASDQTANADSRGHHHQEESSGAEVSGGLSGTNDDRAGSLMHPTKGTLLTYIFEVCFYGRYACNNHTCMMEDGELIRSCIFFCDF